MEPATSPTFAGSVPFDLILAASECHRMADFSKVLRALADVGGAQGCVLWEMVPFAPEERRFFALAEHLPGDLAVYYMPLDSLTGRAVRDKTRGVVNNLRWEIEEGNRAYPMPFLDMGVTAICSVCVSLGEKRDAAVNLYRFNGVPFSEDDLDRIESAAAAIPYLFNSVRNEMGFRLLRQVEDLLHDRGSGALEEILRRVSDAINAVESTVYLEDPLEAPGVYRVRAKIWPWSWPLQEEYRKAEVAMTSWTIRNARTLRFLDLSHFDEEARAFGHEDLVYRNRERFEQAVRAYFRREALPPLSFVCVPVKHHGVTIGALRFCINEARSRFFDDRHVEILELVADQIGECWGTELNLRRGAEEEKRFQLLTKGSDRLNVQSFQELWKADGPSLDRQLQRALDLLAEISGCEEALSIHLVDPQTNELYLAAWKGPLWSEGGKERAQERLARRFPLSANLGFCIAIREKRVVVNEQAGGSPSFPEARRVLHAPILVGDEPVGSVDIRGFGDRPFPKFLELIAGLIARQLGLHHHMFLQFRKLQQTTATLRKNYDAQSQIYDDFHHQISSPIQKAHYFAQRMAAMPHPDSVTLRAIRGNARKAEQVAQHIKYFVALGKDEQIKADEQLIRPSQLLSRVSEMAEDEEAVTDSDSAKELRFLVDAASFADLGHVNIRANAELLDHAVMNLLDNAGKYSFKGTTVTVRASLDQKHFRISVANRGIPISSQDKKRLTERGYRGERASRAVAQGRGIGLYIVKKLMQAMGGDLEIIPTDSGGLNEFRLLLRTVNAGRYCDEHKEDSVD